jgi:succinate dehydrogenase / fumarate reductase, membrane anchor subunit
MSTRSTTRPRPVQPAWSFEYIMWFFTRISGLAMYLLALTGVVGALIMGARTQIDLPTLMRWSFFPNRYHVEAYLGDATAWVTAWWQAMQILLIFFACTHGFNGLRMVIEDYIGRTYWRPLLRSLVFLLWLAMLVVAIFVILQA